MVTTLTYGARPGLLDPFGSACAAVGPSHASGLQQHPSAPGCPEAKPHRTPSMPSISKSTINRLGILDRYGYIPSELRDDGGLDSDILAHPEHWRAAIYHDLVLLKDPGSRFTFVQCRHALRRHGIELQGTVDLVTQI